MKIKLKTRYANKTGNYGVGAILDLEKAEAYSLCEGGYAEQIAEQPVEKEIAAIEPTKETAMEKKPQPRKTANRARKRSNKR